MGRSGHYNTIILWTLFCFSFLQSWIITQKDLLKTHTVKVCVVSVVSKRCSKRSSTPSIAQLTWSLFLYSPRSNLRNKVEGPWRVLCYTKRHFKGPRGESCWKEQKGIIMSSPMRVTNLPFRLNQWFYTPCYSTYLCLIACDLWYLGSLAVVSIVPFQM